MGVYFLAMLKNPKHELFALARAKGATLEEAMTAAGYSPIRNNGSRLISNDNISARIEELKAEMISVAVQAAGFDKALVMKRLDACYVAAFNSNQLHTAVRANELIGKELGMFVDRHRHDIKPIGDWSVDECEQFIGREPTAREISDAFGGSTPVGHA